MAARVALRAEIERNLKELQADQPGLKAWRDVIDADYSAMQKIQNKLSGLNLKDFSRYAPNPKLCDEFGRKGSG